MQSLEEIFPSDSRKLKAYEENLHGVEKKLKRPGIPPGKRQSLLFHSSVLRKKFSMLSEKMQNSL